MTVPMFTPVTWGCVAGVVAPAAIVTVDGDTVTLVVSELARVTVTPPVGAGEGSVMGNAIDWVKLTTTFDGVPTVPEG